jgi:hypothetical protein
MLPARDIHYEMVDRDQAIACCSIGLIHLLANPVGWRS